MGLAGGLARSESIDDQMPSKADTVNDSTEGDSITVEFACM